MLFRRTVQLPVRGKHRAEVASGSAEPGAEHEYVQDCARVRDSSFSCSVQPGRFVWSVRTAPSLPLRHNFRAGFLRIEAVSKLKLRSTVLDGEVVAVDETGIPRFQLLQRFLKQPTAPPSITSSTSSGIRETTLQGNRSWIGEACQNAF